MKVLPLKNIKEIFWSDNKIYITYDDNTKLITNAEGIKLVSDYVNDNEIPLNDHCL